VAHNLWIEVTTAVRPATSGVLYYLAIPVTMVLDTLVLKNPPLITQWAGAALVLLGNGFAWWSATQRRDPAPAGDEPA
jgi:drug/metabolite transporter (DMT)-like permease